MDTKYYICYNSDGTVHAKALCDDPTASITSLVLAGYTEVTQQVYDSAEYATEHAASEPDLVAQLQEENKLLTQQVQALTDQNDFQEELIVELANVVYA